MLDARIHTIITVVTLSSACGQTDPPAEDDSQADTSSSDTSESTSETGDDGDLPPEICNDPTPGEGPLFVAVTNEIGFAVTNDFEPLATGVVAGDLDGDGWEDLIASVFPAQQETPDSPRYRFVFMNRPGPNGERIFVDETDASGIFELGNGNRRGLSVFSLGDLDSDGDLDVVGCPGSGELDPAVIDPCMALLNDGSGYFEPVAEGELSSEVFWVPSSVLLDYDRDGVLDFWPGTVGQWAYGPALVSHPRLYRGAGDGSFTEVGESVGLPQTLTDPDGYRINFGVTSCDINQDGWPEVLLADYYMQPNFAWSFDGTQFTNVAATIGVDSGGLGGHTFSIACGDLDDDGDIDLMTAEVHHPGVAGDISALLVNPGNAGEGWETFPRADLAAAGLYRDEGWMEGDNMPVFLDVDSDGYKDIFMTSSNYPQQFQGDPDWTHAWLWRRIPDGVFEDITPETPWSQAGHESGEGPVWVDFDHDGDLDLVIGTGAFNGQLLGLKNTLRAYRNDMVTTPNWTAIRLHGAGPGAANVSAIGARVTVRAGDLVMHQEQLGSWGHSNTQNEWLTFGLGEACEIDEIEVIWPDAEQTVSRFEAVRGNYRIELHQGSDDVEYLIP
jgi:hypothetical protein